MATNSSESAYQDRVINWFEKLPFCKVTKKAASLYGDNGISDLLVCLRGFYIAIELKKPGRNCRPLEPKTPTEHLQKRYIIAINEAGGESFFSSDFELLKSNILLLDQRLQTICAPFDTLAELILYNGISVKMDSLVNPV